MNKTKRIFIILSIFAAILLFNNNKAKAAQYIWPIGGSNANETYKDYDFYGSRNAEPYKNGKSGREYIVDNKKWPNEQYYYASSESHFGMDISGRNGSSYTVVSVSDGTVIATSGTRVYNPSVNYQDRNQRRTSGGLNDGGGYGNYVVIQEPSTGRCFLYAHLKGGSIKVSKGSTVKAGQAIATMGSSGDSGHMHLHFEIRKSKADTVTENRYGNHYLVSTNSNTNLDPESYIGSTPNVHTPVADAKIVKISKEDAEYYVKYLYKNVLKREAKDNEAEYWANVYVNTGSIYNITSGIFLSKEANNKLGELSNLDFAKKTYEVILYRGKKYTEQEMAGHVDKLNRGIWTRRDYLTMLCNCDEFTKYKINTIIEREKNREEIGIATEDKLKMLGDLDGDGRISAIDASMCLSLYSRLSASESARNKYAYAIKYADVNNDGQVNSIDASIMLEYYANLAVGNFTMEEKSLAQFAGRSEI